MAKIAKAFSPGNISCIFKPYQDKNPRLAGSLGVGFTISEGVIATVKKSATTEILFNNQKITMPTVLDVINAITSEKILVNIKTKLPLGCGFGVSGAAALATALAINKLLDLKKTNQDLAIIAHTQEVKNKTGLGDVANQFFGGFLLKKKPSSYFTVIKVPIEEKAVYCKAFGPLSTKSVLSDKKLIVAINKAANKALKKLENELSKKSVLTLGEVFTISKQFVTESGLLKDMQVKNTILEIEKNGGHATMIILGNSVMSDINFPGATKYFLSEKGAILL